MSLGKVKKNMPSFLERIGQKLYNDKPVLLCLFILVVIFTVVFVGARLINNETATKVNLSLINRPPSKQFLLGTDPSGRDMASLLIIGASNSFLIAAGITFLCTATGILIGLISGFYGGITDNIIMRIIDFFSTLPAIMLIIVIISIVPKYSVLTFIIIMSSFLWMHDVRLIRAKALQQSNLDYVAASKTLGTSDIVIMFREILPNIASAIAVNFTLNLAGNMGLETGLSFLGFGLPFNRPSLGTLLSYAYSPETMQKRPWQWLPAALLILVVILCINFIGQAIKRAADTK